jgi:hypothetical protein
MSDPGLHNQIRVLHVDFPKNRKFFAFLVDRIAWSSVHGVPNWSIAALEDEVKSLVENIIAKAWDGPPLLSLYHESNRAKYLYPDTEGLIIVKDEESAALGPAGVKREGKPVEHVPKTVKWRTRRRL